MKRVLLDLRRQNSPSFGFATRSERIRSFLGGPEPGGGCKSTCAGREPARSNVIGGTFPNDRCGGHDLVGQEKCRPDGTRIRRRDAAAGFPPSACRGGHPAAGMEGRRTPSASRSRLTAYRIPTGCDDCSRVERIPLAFCRTHRPVALSRSPGDRPGRAGRSPPRSGGAPCNRCGS